MLVQRLMFLFYGDAVRFGIRIDGQMRTSSSSTGAMGRFQP